MMRLRPALTDGSCPLRIRSLSSSLLSPRSSAASSGLNASRVGNRLLVSPSVMSPPALSRITSMYFYGREGILTCPKLA